ncbi:hypothetical protein HY546_00815 [archaeon]|nr:hypothetical protein [archaeon]
MDTRAVRKNLPHIAAAIVLIFILLFVLVRFGYVRAADIPGFCGVYQAIAGSPRIAIVAGSDGVGDPETLRSLLAERTGKFADLIPLNQLTAGGVLDNYQIVIVDRAKTMDSGMLRVFSNFVSRGGKLVWIGDAGTGLGAKDLMCTNIRFAYRPSVTAPDAARCQTVFSEAAKISACTLGQCDSSVFNDTEKEACKGGVSTQCGDWVVEEPRDPENAPGLCARTFGNLVSKFVEKRSEIKDRIERAGLGFCASEAEPFQTQGADNIVACEAFTKAALGEGVEPTTGDYEAQCYFGNRIGSMEYKHAVNYWSRGPSELETGELVPPINFGNEVLGIDHVGSIPNVGLFVQAIDPAHPLIRGYAGRSFFGNTPLSIVSAENYRIRTRALMNVEDSVNGKIYPAVLVSNPRGPLIGGVGLVVYYAFPPEVSAIPGTNTPRGAGLNLLDNLIDFTTCR